MRVISGNLKGKSLNFVKSPTTRPLKDSVKENIFNILDHSNDFKIRVKSSYVFDFYSGIGSFGIECISRGARKVTFLETDKTALKILHQNLEKFSIHDRAEVINEKIENFKFADLKKKYQLLFFDPPYTDMDYILYLDLIRKKRIFDKKHLVVIHREKKSKDNLKDVIRIIKKKIYGRSKIVFGTFI